MKAFLLAAGLGTRLKPLTDVTPKCLMSVGNRPLMAYWFDLFEQCGVTDVLVNTHYLKEQVKEFVTSEINRDFVVHLSYEEILLGSAGTILANQNFINPSEDKEFLICYADNYSEVDLGKLVDFHKKKDGLMTMAVQTVNNPSACGIAMVDNDNKVLDFIEKPQNPIGNIANAGIYVANTDIFKMLNVISSLIPSNEPFDIGKHVIPVVAKTKLYAYFLNERHIDIGTFENLKRARDLLA